MKKFLVSFMAMLSLFTASVNHHVSAVAESTVFGDVDSYQIYYDTLTDKIIRDMDEYDLVILEPRMVTEEEIARIQKQGTKVLGYLNVMEQDEWNTEVMEKLQPNDFFYRNGKKVFFPKWKSYLMDLTSPHYQTILHQDLQQQIVQKGFDGVFLDTVGDIDDQHSNHPKILKEQRDALVHFLKDIREKYGDIPVVQNWGFETLETSSAPYVNAIMWEGFNQEMIANDEWSQDKIKDLLALQETYSLDVFTVSAEKKQKSITYAKQFGFVHTHEPDHYNKWSF